MLRTRRPESPNHPYPLFKYPARPPDAAIGPSPYFSLGDVLFPPPPRRSPPYATPPSPPTHDPSPSHQRESRAQAPCTGSRQRVGVCSRSGSHLLRHRGGASLARESVPHNTHRFLRNRGRRLRVPLPQPVHHHPPQRLRRGFHLRETSVDGRQAHSDGRGRPEIR